MGHFTSFGWNVNEGGMLVSHQQSGRPENDRLEIFFPFFSTKQDTSECIWIRNKNGKSGDFFLGMYKR